MVECPTWHRPESWVTTVPPAALRGLSLVLSIILSLSTRWAPQIFAPWPCSTLQERSLWNMSGYFSLPFRVQRDAMRFWRKSYCGISLFKLFCFYMCLFKEACQCSCGEGLGTHCRTWFSCSTMRVPGTNSVVRLGSERPYLLSHFAGADTAFLTSMGERVKPILHCFFKSLGATLRTCGSRHQAASSFQKHEK